MKTHTIFSSVKGWVQAMVKRQRSEERIIYSINVEDIQTVADEVLKRSLTEAEIAKIEDAVGEKRFLV